MTTVTTTYRPALGFIVEGHSEFAACMSFAARCGNCSNPDFKRVNCRGFGGLYKDFEEHLDDILKFSPLRIIVSFDLSDAINDGVGKDCIEVIESFNTRIDSWLTSKNLPTTSFPLSIVVVLQCPEFETWIVAGADKLEQHDMLTLPVQWYLPGTNIDVAIPNPVSWLNKHSNGKRNWKRSSVVKEVVHILDPVDLETRSRSFRKFAKEVRVAMDQWSRGLLTDSSPII